MAGTTVPMFSPDGQLGDIPYENMHAALANGGKLGVNMQAPDGTHGVIPADQVQAAQKAGGKPIAYNLAPPPRSAVWSGVKAFGSDLWNMAKGTAQTASSMATNPVGTAVDAGVQMNDNDQHRKAEGRSAAYRAVAPVGEMIGVNARGMEDAADQGDSGAILGHAAAPLAAAGIVKGVSKVVPGVTEGVKNNFLVSDDLKAQAAATPDAATTATAARTAGDIHASATPKVTTDVGGMIDRSASQIGADTSNIPSLSAKADVAGKAYRTEAQKIYGAADAKAQELTGMPGTKFQDFANDIHDLEAQARDRSLSPTQLENINAKLATQKAKFVSYQKEMVDAGLDPAILKKADKLWSQGASLDELSRHILTGEDAAGNLKPSARPLDTPVKKLTATASPRGHVLKNAVGEDAANNITQSVTDAAQTIQQAKDATRAAKQSVADTNAKATAAQKQIAKIRKRQLTVGVGAASVLGGGAVLRKGAALMGH